MLATLFVPLFHSTLEGSDLDDSVNEMACSSLVLWFKIFSVKEITILLPNYDFLMFMSGWITVYIRGYIWWQCSLHRNASSISRGYQRLLNTR